MDDTTKPEWTEPSVRPLTETDSRADVQDVPATNGVSNQTN
jgi:hypothetical protein